MEMLRKWELNGRKETCLILKPKGSQWGEQSREVPLDLFISPGPRLKGGMVPSINNLMKDIFPRVKFVNQTNFRIDLLEKGI